MLGESRWHPVGQAWRRRLGGLRLRVGRDVGGGRGWILTEHGEVVGLGHEASLGAAMTQAEEEAGRVGGGVQAVVYGA